MKITVAKYSGFCFGVKRAVDIALEDYDIKTYTYGQIIHNGEFQKKLEKKDINIEITPWLKKVLSYKEKFPSTKYIDGKEDDTRCAR